MSDIRVYNKVFPIMSYFDNGGITGVRSQAMNDMIVEKDKQPSVRGGFVGLQPSSQTPVSFRSLTAKRSSNLSGGSPPFILAPGQFMKFDDMDGFEWGLPAGWMGGGFASLLVAEDPAVFAGWTAAKSEVLIHRVRLQIVADGAPAGLTFVKAWPNRFPWPSSKPGIAVEPTRVTLRLRNTALAAQGDMRILFKACDELDTGTDGITPGTTDITNIDVSFAMAAPGIAAVAFPVVEITPPRLGGDVATIALVDVTSGASPLATSYVDIARYGRI